MIDRPSKHHMTNFPPISTTLFHLRIGSDGNSMAEIFRSMYQLSFFAGLVKTMWAQMSEFWKTHCDDTHKKDDSGPSPEKEIEFKNRIHYFTPKSMNVWPPIARPTFIPF
jgi:hypothetical protein